MAHGSWSGLVYSSGTITATGNSGVLDMADILSPSILRALPAAQNMLVIEKAWLKIIPANLATDETLDVVISMAWLADDTGNLDVHAFTQVTSTNVAETAILPGEDSTGELFVSVGTNGGAVTAPVPPYWTFTHTLAGSTKSMDYTIHGAFIYVV